MRLVRKRFDKSTRVHIKQISPAAVIGKQVA